MTQIVIITGQTATGKTSLAYDFAKKFNGEIINADSRQVYRYLDIISSKDMHPAFPTYLYDIVDPKKPFSSFEWVQRALQSIKRLNSEEKTPIIVGGSYLYLKHLLYGVDTEGIGPDWPLRKELENKTLEELQQMLKNLSVQKFKLLNQSDRNNPRRLMRKIEIESSRRHSGDPVMAGDSRIDPGQARMTDVKFIGLRFKNKENLTKAIQKRVEDRIKTGAFEEVEKLLQMGYNENDPGLKTIGYQQLIKYFQKKLTKEEAIGVWITKEIQYAKRQYTFMKKDHKIIWREI